MIKIKANKSNICSFRYEYRILVCFLFDLFLFLEYFGNVNFEKYLFFVNRLLDVEQISVASSSLSDGHIFPREVVKIENFVFIVKSKSIGCARHVHGLKVEQCRKIELRIFCRNPLDRRKNTTAGLLRAWGARWCGCEFYTDKNEKELYSDTGSCLFIFYSCYLLSSILSLDRISIRC